MVRTLLVALTTLLAACDPGRPCTGDLPAPCDQKSCCGRSYTVCAVCIGEGSWEYPVDDTCHFSPCNDAGARDTGTTTEAALDSETAGTDVASDEGG